jgi:hypothetical protein
MNHTPAGLLEDLPSECRYLIAVWRYRGLTDAEIIAHIAGHEGEREEIRRVLAEQDAMDEGTKLEPRPPAGSFRVYAPGERVPLDPAKRQILRLILTVLDRIADQRAIVAAHERATGDAIEAELAGKAETLRKKKPRFNLKQAESYVAARRVSGVWKEEAPTQRELGTFLRQFFGVPNEQLRKLHHKFFGKISRGPRPKNSAK